MLLLAAAPVVLPCTLAAQTAGSGAVADARALWEDVTNYIVRAAEEVPEPMYAFQPTPDVRTFGQLIAHIAGAQNSFCGLASGVNAGGEADIERTVTKKADLVAALKASNDVCRKAYAQSDAAAMAMVKLFGQDRTRRYTLMMNATHDNEHYGNIVTYMRIKGMVPPSSQPPK
jgi:uncharacterized damage-inducible protein DinB